MYEGKTTGTPIALLIRNTDQRSKDYGKIAQQFRPGHADYTYWQKYGMRDPRGGGRSSARLTAPMVAAGAIAKKWLAEHYGTRVSRLHGADRRDRIPFESWDARAQQPLLRARWPTSCRARGVHGRAAQVRRLVRRADPRHRAQACRSGLGEPLYGKLDADIACAMMGINAVKGVEIGAGFAASRSAAPSTATR